MNKFLNWASLVLAGIALVVGIGGYFYPQATSGFGVPSEGASCSGISNCTAFPGQLRSDSLTLSGSAFGGNLTLSNGALIVASTTAVSVLNGQTILNDFVWASAGFSQTFSTSTALTATQFCNTTNQNWVGGAQSGAVMTSTLPTATSSYLACGNPQFGAMNTNIITNDSTSTIDIVAGSGMTFMCETNGVGTTTIAGNSGGIGCTSSLVALNPTSTVMVQGYWDGASSTMKVMWGNEYH